MPWSSYPSREPGEQRHGRSLRQNAQTRLRSGKPDIRRRMRPYIDRKLDGGLQHCSPALPAGLPLTERIHQRPISIRRVSGLIGSTPSQANFLEYYLGPRAAALALTVDCEAGFACRSGVAYRLDWFAPCHVAGLAQGEANFIRERSRTRPIE